MTSLEITLLTREIGAEIRGVDLAGELTDETIASIRAAWLEHLVVFFPDQELTPETQVAFARRFGEITEGHPVEPSLPEHPNVLPIDSAKNRVDFWHTDVTFMREPPAGSLLYALEVPAVGGDTLWTTTRSASLVATRCGRRRAPRTTPSPRPCGDAATSSPRSTSIRTMPESSPTVAGRPGMVDRSNDSRRLHIPSFVCIPRPAGPTSS